MAVSLGGRFSTRIIPLTCITLLLGAVPSLADDAFVGKWANVDDKTRGPTRIEIAEKDKGWTIQVWGRAGAKTAWYVGDRADDLKDYAWYAENLGDRTHSVGQKKANPWALFDMYGNVAEWCWDRYDPEYFKKMSASDPPGPGTGRERVFRGGAWNSPLPRTSARLPLGFTYGGSGSINHIGFRLARNAE